MCTSIFLSVVIMRKKKVYDKITHYWNINTDHYVNMHWYIEIKFHLFLYSHMIFCGEISHVCSIEQWFPPKIYSKCIIRKYCTEILQKILNLIIKKIIKLGQKIYSVDFILNVYNNRGVLDLTLQFWMDFT